VPAAIIITIIVITIITTLATGHCRRRPVSLEGVRARSRVCARGWQQSLHRRSLFLFS
jgi:hypothetical protein